MLVQQQCIFALWMAPHNWSDLKFNNGMKYFYILSVILQSTLQCSDLKKQNVKLKHYIEENLVAKISLAG